jgi:non-homologous end joining protein Ku
VLDIIARKADGEVLEAALVTEAPGAVVDLLAALEASLEAAKSKPA